MATKTSTILEEAASSFPLTELTSGLPLYEWPIPQDSSKFSIGQERITQFEPANYRIALVSFHDDQGRTGAGQSLTVGINQVFLLPLTWTELVTRACAPFSLSGPVEENKLARFGHISIDFSSMEVRQSDRQVNLTAMEFKVLKFFVSNPRRVISRDELLNEVWGYDNYPCTRTVDNHVLKLRQKLELEPAHPVHLLTVHGTGYKFVP
jgi:DNA-binding response OmpR family regulator